MQVSRDYLNGPQTQFQIYQEAQNDFCPKELRPPHRKKLNYCPPRNQFFDAKNFELNNKENNPRLQIFPRSTTKELYPLIITLNNQTKKENMEVPFHFSFRVKGPQMKNIIVPVLINDKISRSPSLDEMNLQRIYKKIPIQGLKAFREFLARVKKARREEEESQEYIQRLLEQDKKELIERKQRISKEEEKNSCGICLDSLFSGETIPFQNCADVYHQKCVERFFIEQINNRSFPIKCPNISCKKEVAVSDVMCTFRKNNEYATKFENNSFQFAVESNQEFTHCLTPNCPYVCFMSKDVSTFHCEICRKTYCVKCKTDWHKGITCEQYQEDKRKQSDDEFILFAKQMKYQQCPKCQRYTEKIDGCNSVTCTRCKTPFCFGCGKEGSGHSNCLGRVSY